MTTTMFVRKFFLWCVQRLTNFIRFSTPCCSKTVFYRIVLDEALHRGWAISDIRPNLDLEILLNLVLFWCIFEFKTASPFAGHKGQVMPKFYVLYVVRCWTNNPGVVDFGGHGARGKYSRNLSSWTTNVPLCFIVNISWLMIAQGIK